MFRLDGKTALVTGASGGIGSSIAKVFVRQGAQVILSGTRVQVLENLKNELLKDFEGSSVHVLPCNLGNIEEANNLFLKAEEIAPVDILINNAGVTRDNLLMRMKDEDWDTVIELNLTSCFRLSKAAVKKMMSRRYGRIINITSVVATMGNAGQANYCAAKAGLIGFSKALAKEVASRNITVNSVAPGFIDTAMTKDLPDTVKTQISTQIPMGKMGSGEDIANACLFLSAQESAYITGQTLHVNGGLDMI